MNTSCSMTTGALQVWYPYRPNKPDRSVHVDNEDYKKEQVSVFIVCIGALDITDQLVVF